MKVYYWKDGSCKLYDVVQRHADGALTLSLTNNMGVRNHELAVDPKRIVPQRLSLVVMTVSGTDHTNRTRKVTMESPLADTTFLMPHGLFNESKRAATLLLGETHGEEFIQHVTVDFYYVEHFPAQHVL